MFLDFESLKSEKEKLRHKKDELLKENDLLKKDADALKAKVFESAPKTSSNVSELQKIIKLLKYYLEKMVNGFKNIDLILGSQRPYFEKLGLGYEKEENEKASRSSQDNVPICIYCFKMGHSSEKYLSRRKTKK